MIQEMKKAFWLTKYCFQLKMNYVSAILVTLGGILSLIGSGLIMAATTTASVSASPYLLGSFYLLLGPMVIAQMHYILLFSNMIKSSPKGRFLEIQMLDLSSAIISLAGYTLVVIYTLTVNHFAACDYPSVYPLTAGILIGLLMIFLSTSYKLFLTSMIGLGICVLIIFTAISILTATSSPVVYSLTTTASSLLGYLAILICLGLSALLRRALYKLPLSKLAAGTKLRKEL